MGFVITLIIAVVAAVGVFAYMQLNTTMAYVSRAYITPGTQITTDMLNDGTIELVQVTKSMTNEYLISDFNQIEGRYAKYNINPGHPIYAYDIAKSSDLRTNETLVSQNLEAITIPMENAYGITPDVQVGDHINMYGIYEYEIKSITDSSTTTEDGSPILVSQLPQTIQEIFLANGYTKDQNVSSDAIRMSKLQIQNVPVVAVNTNKDAENPEVVSISVGLNSHDAELIFLAKKTGNDVGMTLLPYSKDGYEEKTTTGVIESNELSIKDIYRDGSIVNGKSDDAANN
jgi:hypothetical protein